MRRVKTIMTLKGVFLDIFLKLSWQNLTLNVLAATMKCVSRNKLMNQQLMPNEALTILQSCLSHIVQKYPPLLIPPFQIINLHVAPYVIPPSALLSIINLPSSSHTFPPPSFPIYHKLTFSAVLSLVPLGASTFPADANPVSPTCRVIAIALRHEAFPSLPTLVALALPSHKDPVSPAQNGARTWKWTTESSYYDWTRNYFVYHCSGWRPFSTV